MFGFEGHVNPRQLIFELGNQPSVTWDWWIDEDSPASLVREEFKHTGIFTDYGKDLDRLERVDEDVVWAITWPIIYQERVIGVAQFS